MTPPSAVTNLLAAWGKGDKSALNALMPLVYTELHRIARHAWNLQHRDQTLQPTALINEAYLKLAKTENASFQDRCHFFAVASTAMRHILVNHARGRLSEKRGGASVKISLDDAQPAVHQEASEVVALNDAMQALQAIEPRQCQVVEMRYFGGLSVEETAEAMGLSVITVNRDWRSARDWLTRQLSAPSLAEPPIHLAADLLETQPAKLAAGQRVAGYTIESLLSVGGMGEVYRARDSSGRPVALKILRRHLTFNPEAVDRFETEARAASALRHPNIVAIYESAESPDGLFIAMEWLDGLTLRQRMKEGPIDLAKAIDWAAQLASALSAAHAAGILHRDIKPENIMLASRGSVKILDFGLARFAGPMQPEPASTGASGTISGSLSGTLLYMSPEIFRGEPATSASDIFSLGGLLYELVTGHHPFAGETNLEVYGAIECRPVAPASSLRLDVPTEIDTLLMAMLDRDPAARPTAKNVCQVLDSFITLTEP